MTEFVCTVCAQIHNEDTPTGIIDQGYVCKTCLSIFKEGSYEVAS